MYNVILRYVHQTTVAMEKQTVYSECVSVALVLCCHL
jgi:hypothetical protein